MIGQSEAVHCLVSGDEIFNIRAWQLTENSGRAKHWKIKLVVARQLRGVLSGVSGRGCPQPGQSDLFYYCFCLGVTVRPSPASETVSLTPSYVIITVLLELLLYY